MNGIGFDNGKEAKTKMTTLTTEQKRKACEMALADMIPHLLHVLGVEVQR